MQHHDIDVERLRSDLAGNCLGAAFVGGFGAAFLEIDDVENASYEKLINIAHQNGIDISKYFK